MSPTYGRVGFVSTRIAGTDGVSLEINKWDRALRELGYECFHFAGECDYPDEISMEVPEAHFEHPDIQRISVDLFDDMHREAQTTELVHEYRRHLREKLKEFVKRFDLTILIAENALSLPMNVPLGLAITELVAETQIPAVGHHHDFTWERSRYAVHAASDFLQAAFPPDLPMIHHVVINSFAGRQLAWRCGVGSSLIPNVMDFEDYREDLGDQAAELRETLGIGSDEFLILQPTRVVPRKRIERSMELVKRLDCGRCTLVVTHAAGDEGTDYLQYLRDYAEMLGVKVVFNSGIINHERGETEDGRPVFSLADAYKAADLVTYPSGIEGFGNAFLETIFYKRPIVVSNYETFQTDIQPKGFRVISFDQFITDDTVEHARHVLEYPESEADNLEHNFRLGQRYYSESRLKECLIMLMRQIETQ